MTHQGYGFCEFLTEEDAEYACKIMNQIKLWGKPIRVNKACLSLARAWFASCRGRTPTLLP
jgi:RNA recognition motif-containing protein